MEWSILQQDEPDDFVIATGEQHSVREFVVLAAKELGITLRWEGTGLQERGVIVSVDSWYPHKLVAGMTIVRVDPQFFRPAEVDALLGDSSKALRKLGWRPKTTFQELVAEMAREDYLLAQQQVIHEPCVC
jgi:GDPmannose 4,6-dehydratase